MKRSNMVVNGVSRNGNFDINVGPTAEGIISDVEREPLLTLGRWLKVNGPLAWRRDGDGIIIDYPLHKARPALCPYAWVFKIRVKRN